MIQEIEPERRTLFTKVVNPSRSLKFISVVVSPRKILAAIESERFMDVFRDKTALADYLRALPVYVILNSFAGLHGAPVQATAMCLGF